MVLPDINGIPAISRLKLIEGFKLLSMMVPLKKRHTHPFQRNLPSTIMLGIALRKGVFLELELLLTAMAYQLVGKVTLLFKIKKVTN